MTVEKKIPVFKIESRIFTKSLALIVAILLPVTALFQFMKYQGDATEKVLESERRNLEYSTRINRTASSACLASGYLTIYLLMNNEKARVNWLKMRQTLIDETQGLDAFSKTTDDVKRNKLVRALVEKTYAAISDWSGIKPASSTNDFREISHSMRSIRFYFLRVFQLSNVFQTMEADDHGRLIAAIEKVKGERESFTLWLNIALFVIFALSLGLVFLFSREITDRLKLVVENASRLPQREKLHQKVSGSDEIAYLDNTLHQAAEKLEQSAQFRKNLLEMVAHDMCSPLSAVNLSLAILQRGDEDSVSEKTANRFGEAGKRIEQLVLKANNLLSIERLCANSPDLAFSNEEINTKKSNSEELQPESQEDAPQDENITELSRLIRVEFRTAAGLGSDAAKRFRPQIFKKGLILVLVPFLFSAGMIYWAGFLNQKAAQYLNEEMKQTEIAFTISTMLKSSVAKMVINGCYQMYGDQENKDLQPFINKTSENVQQKLLDLTRSDLWMVDELQKLSALEQKEQEKLSQFKPVVTDVRSLPAPNFAGPGRSLIIFSMKKMEKIQKMINHQMDNLATIRQDEAKAGKDLDNCLQAGIAGCFIIALILLFAFDNDISRRLKVLTANAERLPLRKKLNEFVKGRDEIWYLDFVLHDVAEILESTWQQRKVMMEVLAGDLRKPLRETEEILGHVPEKESQNFDDVRKRHFNFAKANVDRVLSLVDALLTIENLEQGKIELVKCEFPARDAAQEAITSLTALAQDRKVSLANDCDDLQLSADKGRVIQVLVNFLGNAINHSPPDTTVRIDTSRTPSGVRFDVIDSGPGLSLEMRSKVFERFFQTADSKTKGKGYGLGLAICKMIAEAHGGSVGCDAASTGGCSFYAIFPN